MHKKFRHRLILLIITLSLLIASYEILLTWQRYPMATIDTSELSNMKQYYEHKHIELTNQQFDTKHLHVRNRLQYLPQSAPQAEKDIQLDRGITNRRTLKQLLQDPDIKQLPVKVELDCTQERLYSLNSNNNDDIVCINETQLWSDMSQRSVDVSALSDRQRKAALVRAVLAHLERKDEEGDLFGERDHKELKEHREEQVFESQIEEPEIQVDPILGSYNEGDMMYKVQREDDNQEFDTQIQEPELQVDPVVDGDSDLIYTEELHRDEQVFDTQIEEPELQVDPVVDGDSDLIYTGELHRDEQVFDTQIEEPEKQVDPVLVLLKRGEQVPIVDKRTEISTTEHAPVLKEDSFPEHAVPNFNNGQSKPTTEHALMDDNGRLKFTTERAPIFNNGRSVVSTERAPAIVDNNAKPKLPTLVQHSDNLDQLDHGNHDNNDDPLAGQSMPKWIPQEFIHNEDNLQYSNQGAPLPLDPDESENQNNLIQNDPLNSVLVPMGHNLRKDPRRRGPIVAKKQKKSAKKMPTDYFWGLNLDEDRPPLTGKNSLNFDPKQVSPNTSNVNSNTWTTISNHSIALNVSELHQNESNALVKHHKASGGLIQMNEQLYQLVGYTLPVNYDLRARRLPTEFNAHDTHMLDRLKYLNEAVESSDEVLRGVTSTSLHPDLIKRSKFQQHQMKLFCSQTHMDSDLPINPDDLDTLFQHLLYDDSKRLIFCYVPKNGCSNMKRMMLVLNGILPPESVSEKRPAESVLKQVHSFRNLTLRDALYKLRYYYKAIIVRNPMERLLSAYRNKLETPLNYTTRKQFPDRLKAYILRKYNSKILNAWIEYGNYNIDLHPSFSDFLQFMVKFPLRLYNEHFKPSLDLCFPCAVHYDYYLNFKSMEYDVYALIHFLGIPFDYYPSFFAHPEQRTSDFVESYFGGVALAEKVKLFNAFSQELEFYYSLYPEEWGMHKDL